ncbi:hypothetical protein [Aquincola sp. J276]|uniref:hypothetical protein n=1 Tax=Aquincola sp. J276 TaxID=2898432 RepID=UPI002151490F|nr:hypothetical protein [Aquincola sp. J276]MCR5867945.1 hypothetical protein [Aquincola sp. J276]
MKILEASAWRIGALAGLGLLAGCGGGGGGEGDAGTPASAAFSAEGVYGGTLNGSSALSLQMLVLDNGQLWALYGQQSNGRLLVSGFFQGGSSASTSGIRATDLRDFGTAPPMVLNLSASTGTAAGTLAGTLATSQGSASFSVGPDPSSTYRYEARALPAMVQGSWTLTTLQGEVQSVTVAANGNLTASGLSGCNFSGTVLPRASGKNVFDVTLRFGPAPCALPNQTATGIALAYPLDNGSTQLVVAVHDAGRTAGTAAFGVR